MKTILRHLLVTAFIAIPVWAEDGATLPPIGLRAEWAELEKKKFADWAIKGFLGWEVPFDGGSKVFFFESATGDKFGLMVANPVYWTVLERKSRRQVFFVLHGNRFYRIEPKSEEEQNLIEKLAKAANELVGEGKTDPKLLKSLAERLESRDPMFTPKD